MHFDSHGLQGLIVRGLVNRPAGGFITSNINPTTMSVISSQPAQTAARGSSSQPAQTAARGSSSQPAQTAARGSSPQPAQAAARGSFTGTTTGITSITNSTGSSPVGDRGDPQLIQQAGGLEAAAAPPQAQLAALNELAAQLKSDITSALDGEAQQEAQRGLINQLQAILRGITIFITTNITIDVDTQPDVGEFSLLADLEGAAKEQLTKIKLIRRLSAEYTYDTYMGFNNQQQEKPAAKQGSANISKAESSDSRSSSDEAVDWVAIYKKTKKRTKR